MRFNFGNNSGNFLNFKNKKFRNLKFREFVNFGTWELRNFKFRELGSLGTSELQVPGTWELGNFGTSSSGNLGASELGNFGTWELRNSLSGVPIFYHVCWKPSVIFNHFNSRIASPRFLSWCDWKGLKRQLWQGHTNLKFKHTKWWKLMYRPNLFNSDAF